MKSSLTNLFALLLSMLSFYGALQAQAPDVVYRVRTNDGLGGPFPTWQFVDSSWSSGGSTLAC